MDVANYIQLNNYNKYEIMDTYPFTIRNRETKHELKPFVNIYPSISLNGKNIFIHRIIAKQFLNNPNNYHYVIHKNGDKNDYNLNNLEWSYKPNPKPSSRIAFNNIPSNIIINDNDLSIEFRGKKQIYAHLQVKTEKQLPEGYTITQKRRSINGVRTKFYKLAKLQ